MDRTDRWTQHCSISATVAYLVRSAKNAHWSHYNVSNQYKRMSLYNSKRSPISYLMTITDRLQSLQSVGHWCSQMLLHMSHDGKGKFSCCTRAKHAI